MYIFLFSIVNIQRASDLLFCKLCIILLFFTLFCKLCIILFCEYKIEHYKLIYHKSLSLCLRLTLLVVVEVEWGAPFSCEISKNEPPIFVLLLKNNLELWKISAVIEGWVHPPLPLYLIFIMYLPSNMCADAQVFVLVRVCVFVSVCLCVGPYI